MEKFEVRTDLALEANEDVDQSDSRLKGIIVEEHTDKETDIRVTTLQIINKEGAEILGKPIGTYITIEAEELSSEDDEYNHVTANILADNLEKLIIPHVKHKKHCHVLVVGLGNREVTADSLGPDVVENLLVNRHISKDYSAQVTLAGLSPGVMAQTGMETAEIIKGIVAETKPDVVIAIDALAARNTRRLNTTIQLSDKGINPGSGVGNHRVGITKETVGAPVIGIGVPTVVDAPTIVNDTMENFIRALGQSKQLQGIATTLSEYTPEEKYQLVKEIIAPEMVDMYVTPKDVDATVKVIGNTLSEAINIVAQKELV
jgi:spore protease